MKTALFTRMLLLSGLVAFGSAANASDELAGALIGAGSGAVIGHAIGHQDGAVVGGILGAMIGIAIADDDDDRRGHVRHHHAPVYVKPGYARPYYGPAPVVVYQQPRVRYAAPPVFVKTYPAPGYWKNDRFDRRDHRWDRDNDRRHDGRNDGRRDRNDRDDDRGDRRGR